MGNLYPCNIDINSKDNHGMTGFYLACERGCLDVVRIFMDNAATLSINLNTKDNNGMTTFHLACQRGCLDVVKISNIDLNAKNIRLERLDY